MIDVRIIPPDQFMNRAGTGANPYTSLLMEPGVGTDRPIACTVATWRGEAPHPRTLSIVPYLEALASRVPPETLRAYPGAILFQGEDNPRDVPSVSWQSQRGWDSIGLIPDLYYFSASGYVDIKGGPAWRERRPVAIWRGSTTGTPQMAAEELDALPRYRMCAAAKNLGDASDIRFSAVVQARSEQDHATIHERLSDEHLFGTYVTMNDMANSRIVMDVDGNANSWNFLWKMRLGSCIVKVESDWVQWFVGRLEPWRHYVPVRSDLLDLCQKIEWCLQHDDEAEQIARRGREWACSFEFEQEMHAAAATVFLPRDG